MKLCRAIKSDGTPCNAPLGPGREFCFHHDPERKQQAEEARMRGMHAARQKKKGEPASDVRQKPLKRFKLNSLDDVKRLLAASINEFRVGRISADEARVLAYVSNILIGAIKDSDIESRLKELEERIRERGIIGDRY